MNFLGDLLPIFICVILPSAIVLIVTWGKINADNKRSSVLIKAIESGRDIDTDKVAQLLAKPKFEREDAEIRSLRRGLLYTIIGAGLALFVIFMAFNGEVPGDGDTPTFSAIGSLVCIAVGISNLVVYSKTRK